MERKKRKERRRERVIEVSKSAIWKLKKANMILNFDFDLPVKLHQDDVLKVQLVVGVELLSKKPCI